MTAQWDGRASIGYRESQVAAFILRHFTEHGVIPSSRTIAAAIGIGSKGEVDRIVARIKRRHNAYVLFARCASHLHQKSVINECPK